MTFKYRVPAGRRRRTENAYGIDRFLEKNPFLVGWLVGFAGFGNATLKFVVTGRLLVAIFGSKLFFFHCGKFIMSLVNN